MIKRELLKFEDRNDIVRDSYSKAIINQDRNALSAAKMQKAKSKKIEGMEKDINELKNLIQTLIHKLDKKDDIE